MRKATEKKYADWQRALGSIAVKPDSKGATMAEVRAATNWGEKLARDNLAAMKDAGILIVDREKRPRPLTGTPQLTWVYRLKK